MKRLLSLVLFCSAVAAQAGTATSGGGGAFVCRDSSGNILSSELLDLWEARNVFGLNIPYLNDPVDVQISRALAKLALADSAYAQKISQELTQIQANAQYLGPEVTIPAPTDAYPEFSKTGCPLEGMMLYHGKMDRLLISSPIFSQLLNNTNIAAAWIHEAVYKFARPNGIRADSTHSRKLTACLFSTDDCLGLSSAPQAPTTPGSFRCTNSQVDFYLFRDSTANNDWRMLFQRIGTQTFTKLIFYDPHFGFRGPLLTPNPASIPALGLREPTRLVNPADDSLLYLMKVNYFKAVMTGEIVFLEGQTIPCQTVVGLKN